MYKSDHTYVGNRKAKNYSIKWNGQALTSNNRSNKWVLVSRSLEVDC